MSAHPHPHPRREWGEPAPPLLARVRTWLAARLGRRATGPTAGLPELPLALRRGELADLYLAAERAGDHAAAGSAAAAASERAVESRAWWQADAWAHRALWHFERAEQTLEATRQARRIGDLRVAAGDPDSARRYYAEAIDEARDIGAEQEQGLAALGLGRAHLELGQVTPARRLAGAAITLLERSQAPGREIEAARELLGIEKAVGADTEDG